MGGVECNRCKNTKLRWGNEKKGQTLGLNVCEGQLWKAEGGILGESQQEEAAENGQKEKLSSGRNGRSVLRNGPFRIIGGGLLARERDRECEDCLASKVSFLHC